MVSIGIFVVGILAIAFKRGAPLMGARGRLALNGAVSLAFSNLAIVAHVDSIAITGDSWVVSMALPDTTLVSMTKVSVRWVVSMASLLHGVLSLVFMAEKTAVMVATVHRICCSSLRKG
jgi:hypothetical protein